MSNPWFRPRAARKFNIGDRIEWDGRDLGTVVKIIDEDSLAVEWDNPKLGRTMAPSWSMRLQLALQIDDEVTAPWCMPDGPTIVDWA